MIQYMTYNSMGLLGGAINMTVRLLFGGCCAGDICAVRLLVRRGEHLQVSLVWQQKDSAPTLAE